MDIFVGGGADDLGLLGFGVMRSYARTYAALTGRRTLYVANARDGRLRQAIATVARAGDSAGVVGHSWGGPDAWRAAAWAERRGFPVRALVTLDPVGGPTRRRFDLPLTAPWLNVEARPSAPDGSDRLTALAPWARKPGDLPLRRADRHVILDVNHRDVTAMMERGGGRAWLEAPPARR